MIEWNNSVPQCSRLPFSLCPSTSQTWSRSLVRTRRIIGQDAVGRNAGAFVYGTNAGAFISFSLSIHSPLSLSLSSFKHLSLSFSLSLAFFLRSTDAQIKDDSGRAESPFRMKRPRLHLFHFLLLLLLLPCPHSLAPVLVVNDRGTEVSLKCTVIARHKYRLHFESSIARPSILIFYVCYWRGFLSPREESSRSTSAPFGSSLGGRALLSLVVYVLHDDVAKEVQRNP